MGVHGIRLRGHWHEMSLKSFVWNAPTVSSTIVKSYQVCGSYHSPFCALLGSARLREAAEVATRLDIPVPFACFNWLLLFAGATLEFEFASLSHFPFVVSPLKKLFWRDISLGRTETGRVTFGVVTLDLTVVWLVAVDLNLLCSTALAR